MNLNIHNADAKKVVTLIVPVFNEEESIQSFCKAVATLSLEHYEFDILFIDDGSQDRTVDVIKSLQKTNPHIHLISFIRNFGKEAALFAGLTEAKGDAVIPMDVDLQDPIEVVPEFIKEWEKGADVVLGKRRRRHGDSLIKRLSAAIFYKLHNKICSVQIKQDVGDFRLISAELVPNITNLRERNLFMKGLLNFAGGKEAIVEYDRPARLHGDASQSPIKLLRLALNGIFGYSTVPLRLSTYFGVLSAGVSFCYALYALFETFIKKHKLSGSPLLLTIVLFLGGVQLISIGLLGEYIGRMYIEIKDRPRYLLKRDNT
ncbi:glycosyltransferase family 2 protein [Acetobacteraceae bacterium]|nr:glycosyltransferase family 2 protein [Acetobacteraceae bacterium]